MSPRKSAEQDFSADAAFERALTLLEYRPRTVQQMYRALLQRGFGASEAEDAVTRLVRIGYLNDTLYAQDFVQSTLRKGQGMRKAQWELRARGVQDETVRQAVENIDAQDEFEAALLFGEKLWRRTENMEVPKRVAKLARALAARGFDYETVRSVLRALDAEAQQDW